MRERERERKRERERGGGGRERKHLKGSSFRINISYYSTDLETLFNKATVLFCSHLIDFFWIFFSFRFA